MTDRVKKLIQKYGLSVATAQAEQISDEVLDAFEAWIKADNVPDSVAAQTAQFYVKEVLNNPEAYDIESGRKAFDSLYGGDTKASERQLKNVHGFMERASGAFADLLDATGLGNHPRVLQEMAVEGGRLALEAEQSEIQAKESLEKDEKAKAEAKQLEAERTDPRVQAKAEIERIRGDKTHPYHTGNMKAVEEMSKLYEVAHGTIPVSNVGTTPLPVGPLSGTDNPRKDSE